MHHNDRPRHMELLPFQTEIAEPTLYAGATYRAVLLQKTGRNPVLNTTSVERILFPPPTTRPPREVTGPP
jgi:hypothetical protein